jgi:peptidoglycan/xylan/chitin deacetylase (PgdA/CDA1 family)
MKKTISIFVCFLFLYLIYLGVHSFLWYETSDAKATNQRQPIPVLAYHSVSDDVKNGYTISPADFEAEMTYLFEAGYQSLTIDEFESFMRGDLPLAAVRKPVLITFDDGYADNYTNAYPILKKFGFVASVFVITDFIKGGYYLSWDQVRELHEAGWDIGAHTRTHVKLPLYAKKKQLAQINDSMIKIKNEIGEFPISFAYPFGLRSFWSVDALKRSGAQLGFTFDDGLASSDNDPLLVHRLYPDSTQSINEFIHMLGGG